MEALSARGPGPGPSRGELQSGATSEVPLTAREVRPRGGLTDSSKGNPRRQESSLSQSGLQEGDAAASMASSFPQAGQQDGSPQRRATAQKPMSKKEMDTARKKKEFEAKLAKIHKLREDDASRFKERHERQQRLKDHKTETMVRAILSENGLKAEAGKLCDEFDGRWRDRKQALYNKWDAEVAQRIEHQVMKYLNPTPAHAPPHFAGRELLQPSDDPLKSLLRQRKEEEGFRKASEFVLLHSPQGGNLEAEVKRRDLIQEAVAHRECMRPMLPVPLWEQRHHYASSLGRFCQSCERGGAHHSARRMGTGAHSIDESDGVPAAGKTKTKYERNKLGLLEGTVAKEGESRGYKRADGHSSGAPCQDHYFYEVGNEAVEAEMPVGKRMYPILKR